MSRHEFTRCEILLWSRYWVPPCQWSYQFFFFSQTGVHGSADNAAGGAASTSGARWVTLQEQERQDADAEKRSDYKSMSKIHVCIWCLLQVCQCQNTVCNLSWWTRSWVFSTIWSTWLGLIYSFLQVENRTSNISNHDNPLPPLTRDFSLKDLNMHIDDVVTQSGSVIRSIRKISILLIHSLMHLSMLNDAWSMLWLSYVLSWVNLDGLIHY